MSQILRMAAKIHLCFGVVLWTVIVSAPAQEPTQSQNVSTGLLKTRRQVLDHLLNNINETDRYDPRLPPDYEEDFPTEVNIRIHLLSFDSVSETTMHYKVELYLTMHWNDSRLKFEHLHDAPWLEVDSKMMSQVWVPDVYFKNAKKASFHNVTVPNKYMHIKPLGAVEFSLRLSLTLSCRMLLQKYPLDSQRCPMLIQSYTYTTENVMFYWQQNPGPISYDPEIALGTELAQFSIVENKTESCNGTMDVDHPKFACIKAHFTLKRDIGYYVIQIYVPGVLIVAVSWVTFWLGLDAVPARVSLGVLTVLTLNTHGSHIQSQLPKVSYIKAIDVWSVCSLIFVFSALLEFAYVNVLTRQGDKELQATQVFTVAGQVVADKDGEVNGDPPRTVRVSRPSPSRSRARKVDHVARWLFPLSFLIFNISYWTFYIYT